MKYLYLLIVLNVFLFVTSCNKNGDEMEPVCINFPCHEKYEKLVNYNRVAYGDPSFRIGMWVNVHKYRTALDTIVFHNDSIWSNYNVHGGIFNSKYDFQWLYLRFYQNYLGEDLDEPHRVQTYYNDTTGIFSILRDQHGVEHQFWDHYIKVK